MVSLHRNELEPCYSCEHAARVPHFLGSEFIGESVVCQCPYLKNRRHLCGIEDDPRQGAGQ